VAIDRSNADLVPDARPGDRPSANGLREQAASCRRLAACARTSSGATSLTTLADRFDEQALQLDPTSLRR
jgi:hypothetical protein